MTTPRAGRADPLEHAVARLLATGTLASVVLIAVGTVLLFGSGRSPMDVAPPVDVGRIPGDLAAFRPAAYLWLGIVGVLATPAARVAAALVGYAKRREWPMALVSVAILVVIAVGVVIGVQGA